MMSIVSYGGIEQFLGSVNILIMYDFALGINWTRYNITSVETVGIYACVVINYILMKTAPLHKKLKGGELKFLLP